MKRANLRRKWSTIPNTNGRTIWIADAHRDNGKRLIVRADENLTVFLELQLAIRDRSLGRTDTANSPDCRRQLAKRRK